MFRPNPRLKAELEASPAYRALIATKALEVKRQAEAIAPRGPTGMYARSIKVDGSRVLTTDFAGHLVEYGGKNNPPYGVLRRAAQAAGLRLEESGPE